MINLFDKIEQRLQSDNWRVVDRIFSRKDCCLWAYHFLQYGELDKRTVAAKAHHSKLGALRACRKCWVCIIWGKNEGLKLPTDDVIISRTPRKPGRRRCSRSRNKRRLESFFLR